MTGNKTDIEILVDGIIIDCGGCVVSVDEDKEELFRKLHKKITTLVRDAFLAGRLPIE